MKPFSNFIFIALISLLTFSCIDEFDTSEDKNMSDIKFDTLTFSHSMKGWELYSWPVDTKWNYSFLPGTNRLKTLNEIINNPLAVTGEDSLKAILYKLPANEQVMWIGREWLSRTWSESHGTLQLPPRNIQIEIKEFCEKRNIFLMIVD